MNIVWHKNITKRGIKGFRKKPKPKILTKERLDALILSHALNLLVEHGFYNSKNSAQVSISRKVKRKYNP